MLRQPALKVLDIRLGHAFSASQDFLLQLPGTLDQFAVLVIHRLGVWDLPKGKVDAGESVEAAAVREVREECGLSEVHLEEFLCDTWHTYVRRGLHHLKRTCWYRMQAPGDQVLIPQTDEDITEVRWADKDLLREVRANTYGSLLPVFSAWEAEGPRSRT